MTEMNKTLTAIVVEDEFKVRNVFTKLLQQYCPQIEIIGEAENISDAYDIIVLKKPAVVFLDIEMPYGNGFELLSKFGELPFEVVFVTSYSHYAIRAIKYSALDYLLKPVMVSDLQNLVPRILERQELKSSADQYRILQKNMDDKEQQTLVVNTKTRTEYLPMNKIMYLQADGNYTLILSEGSKVHVAKTLKEYDAILCDGTSDFVRIHKAYIVNLSHIKHIDRGDKNVVLLNNGISLEVSRRKRQELTERMELKRMPFNQ
jgi:two-component system LytT family response regulator